MRSLNIVRADPMGRDVTEHREPSPGLPRQMAHYAAIGIAIMSLWAGLWVQGQGHPIALLGPGTKTLAWPLLDEEIGVDIGWRIVGHDGGTFYVQARSPFDFDRSEQYLDYPAYRHRRILFPLVAGTLAPGGGLPLVYTMLAISLAGVGLACAACAALPGRPVWLPVAVALTPGVAVSVMVGLCDALMTGLVLAAFAASYHRRWRAVVVLAVLATMTRESSLIAAGALLLTPGMPRRVRVLVVAAPVAVLGAWMLWIDHAVEGGDDHATNQFALPFVDWVDADRVTLLMGLASMAVMGLGARRLRRPDRAVQAFLLVTLLMSAMLSREVVISWVNTSRVMAPALTLGLWALFRTHDPSAATAEADVVAEPEPAPA
jgi:hypothetical protein